jgi:competence protein ComEC
MVLETKFRAFQLDTAGSLFSFYKSGQYTLIEAKIPKSGIDSIIGDLNYHRKTRIDTLHITSWDTDHCSYGDLIQILNKLRPSLIEIPSYEPDSDTGKLCKKTIEGYDDIIQKYKPNVRIMSKDYISNLANATPLHTNNVVYHSHYNSDKKNDMSLIKLFRSNGFNVLSLGDCESQEIANYLLNTGFIQTEVDLLILPHHGADNGFLTGEFLDKVKPKLAVCSSNNGNQYDHPKTNIRALFSTRNIPLMTTKRGDIIVIHEKDNTHSRAINLISNNEDKEPEVRFKPKSHS